MYTRSQFRSRYPASSICTGGDIVVVGCNLFEVGADKCTGCVFVYDCLTNTWSKPLIPSTQHFQHAGDFVACSSDGNTIIAGAPYYGQGGTSNTGCIYIYDRTTNTWSGPLVPPTQALQWAGISVACSSDGNIVIVGAPRYDQGNTTSTGCIYIYDRTANTWSQPIVPPTQAGQRAGISVACSSDGNIVIVGAPGYNINGNNVGCIYMYERSSNTWTQPILPPIWDSQHVGSSVACSSSGNVVVAGSRRKGYTFVYDRKTGMMLDIANKDFKHCYAAYNERWGIFIVSGYYMQRMDLIAYSARAF